MNFTLRQLGAFVAVARTGSFTAAAAQTHVSQPALTVQIRNLEAALGLRLLDRNTRRVELTAVGRELLPVFERVMGDIAAVAGGARELARGLRGIVHVAALPSVCARLLPEVMARLARSHPGITIRLQDAVAQRVAAAVRAEEADLGIATFGPDAGGLEVVPLFRDAMVAVMPAGHRLAARRTVRLRDLAAEPLVFMDTHSSVRHVAERAFAAAGQAVKPAHEVTYMSTAVALVRAGLGIALLPSTAFELDGAAGLAVRRVADPGLERQVGVARKAGRSMSPAATVFLEALREAIAPASPRSRRSAPSPAASGAGSPRPPSGSPPPGRRAKRR